MKRISTVQETIWLTQNIYTRSSLYNVGGYAVINGPLQQAALVGAIEDVLSNTDVIDIGYVAFNDGRLSDNTSFSKYDIAAIDFSTDVDPDKSCIDWMTADMNVVCDVNKNLLKIRLLKAADNKYYWYTKVHHLIFDGYSMSLFFNNVAVLYTTSIKNEQPAMPQLYPYTDFINDEENYRASEEFAADRTFWLNRLRNIPPAKAFESFQKSANNGSLHSQRKETVISRELYNRIELFCKNNNCTAFHYFIATLFILNKSYNNPTPVIGLPVFNRRNKQFKHTIGTFVNMLPFAISVEDGAIFTDILSQVKNDLKDCYRHQRFPLFDILQELDGKDNIYNVSFSYQKNIYETKLGDSLASINYMTGGEQQDDLMFHLLEYTATEDLTLAIDYKEHLFTQDGISRLLNHFNTLLQTFLDNPLVPVDQLDYLSNAEKTQLLVDFNGAAGSYPRNKTLTTLFEEQVTKTPDAIALVFAGKEFSYQSLNNYANQLGAYLRNHYQIQPDDLIGIKLERSEWMIISLLGVLKSGGAYVPIDPEYPQERIDYMLTDSQCKVLIDEAELEKFKAEASRYSNGNIVSVNKASDLAYVIYTSGSTGQPKGCMLEHQGVINRIEWMWHQYDFTATDIILQKTTFTFDVSVWELFMPLCWGAKMVLCQREDTVSPDRILSLILKEGVSCLHFVPGMLNVFITSLFDGADIKDAL
ncbi:Non-ribosomal peptide synthetase component F, partial [Chitinophaga sp. CF118]|uniref:non-ribosomal peptide synthetase n=1 Tax=Chitinophaga sp. CF118 TaxID=1884367 RepID=UPI0008F29642